MHLAVERRFPPVSEARLFCRSRSTRVTIGRQADRREHRSPRENSDDEEPVSIATTTSLARLIDEKPAVVLGALAESYRAVVGVDLKVRPLSNDEHALSTRFGEARVTVFPLLESHARSPQALLVFDRRAALFAGGSFTMMSHEQIRSLAEQNAPLPAVVDESLPEVASLLVDAVASALATEMGESRTWQITGGVHIDAEPWPALLDEFAPPGAPWRLASARLSFRDDECGTVLLAAIDQDGSASKLMSAADRTRADALASALEAVVFAPAAKDPNGQAVPAGLLALIAAPHGDLAARQLRQRLTRMGVGVSRHRRWEEGARTPDLLFVVCRSASEAHLKLQDVHQRPERPPMVVVCSDRPTRELVVAARRGHADGFLVLPPETVRLEEILARMGNPPCERSD